MRTSTAIWIAVFWGTGVAADGVPPPITDADFRPVNLAEAELGQLLFYDPILSGNREVACGTCHHPDFGTGDALSLGIGDGGLGIGPERRADPANLPERRIPRNAQPLFNLGAEEFTVLFHDGRIEVDPDKPGGLRTPLGPEMSEGFATLLAAQTMFPVLSPDEMAGHYSENEIAQAVRMGLITGEDGAWERLSDRVRAIPAYAAAFEQVYGLAPDEIHFTDISNAVAAFIEFEWRSDTAPFDAYLRGQGTLDPLAMEGMALFYGEAQCSTCHSGPFFTDHGFHAMGDMQLGPGKAARFETHAHDVGRMRVTGNAADAFAFRTPSLRNVATTGPYGHAGAIAELGAYLRHHAAPRAGLAAYQAASAVLPALEQDDWRIAGDAAEMAALLAAAPEDRPLDETEIAALVAFLDTLTDPVSATGRLGVPETVPSGLKVPNP